MGAWIEIDISSDLTIFGYLSRPSWAHGLKLNLTLDLLASFLVAPLMGEQIEILLLMSLRLHSLLVAPSWVRGLKSSVIVHFLHEMIFCPTWANEL